MGKLKQIQWAGLWSDALVVALGWVPLSLIYGLPLALSVENGHTATIPNWLSAANALIYFPIGFQNCWHWFEGTSTGSPIFVLALWLLCMLFNGLLWGLLSATLFRLVKSRFVKKDSAKA